MTFQSNGKLLITGEFLILKGATSLAVPLQFQQSFETKISESPALQWISNEKGIPWFEATIDTSSFKILKTSDEQKAFVLVNLLKATIQLNPSFKNKLAGISVATDMDFEKEWGFGSSSSLISNMAYWAGIDPLELHKYVSEGSGYDVLTSRSDGPIYFTKEAGVTKTEKVAFNPSFKDEIYFVYLGQKQDSAKSVQLFNQQKKLFKSETRQISEITYQIAESQTIEDFEYYVKEHEQILASVLKQKPIKETVFNNLQGETKSLGAWGGDFVMITWQYGKKELLKYVEQKKLNVVFSFDELIKTW